MVSGKFLILFTVRNDPRGVANLDPRDMIYLGDLYALLYTQA